ncbi:MmyB family transcriptional regulator [Nocardia sp. SSK8]|uniref:MmyB family transcriptional regulator n=1 Tax=Nocardia sp. SSK8 TaxID=3120154 RepID=UPI00300AA1E4
MAVAGGPAQTQGVLLAHEPYPALAVDRRWNLVLANSAVEVFLDGAAPELTRPPINMMRLGLHPDGLAPRLRNLDQVRSYLLPRLAHQAARSGDPHLHALYEELITYGPEPEPGPPDPTEAALSLRLTFRGTDLCFVNTVTTLGAAFDTALDEIAIEAYLPADLETRRFFRATGSPSVGVEDPDGASSLIRRRTRVPRPAAGTGLGGAWAGRGRGRGGGQADW